MIFMRVQREFLASARQIRNKLLLKVIVIMVESVKKILGRNSSLLDLRNVPENWFESRITGKRFIVRVSRVA